MDLIGGNSAFAASRMHSFKGLSRTNSNNKGYKSNFVDVVMWKDNDSDIIIIEYDLSILGTFQESFEVYLSNKEDEPQSMSLVVYYKAIASPEVSVSSSKNQQTDFIMKKLELEYGNKDDFTVIKENVQEDEKDLFKYTLFYRNKVEREIIERKLKSILD